MIIMNKWLEWKDWLESYLTWAEHILTSWKYTIDAFEVWELIEQVKTSVTWVGFVMKIISENLTPEQINDLNEKLRKKQDIYNPHLKIWLKLLEIKNADDLYVFLNYLEEELR